ncbi:hypothetical protein IMG5_160250 [Ichthyophthirius multifiliis]|uniref:Uncharacterized protein n=1 Tax=Ichthyophthirius multifiliis TaxID=5932 RepID=G0QZW4_ICHMU|nr:hypothetical protein IMG5_160250 [Ichthyophthirius multifiliis]EGR29226.1 hypothetical protein IMG5_160250 [Ichthyophthirius multifiliis]|eukprot:XP_004030462.1 hypothetical protein IMG5_160250 [Ichthyophthirius multifiliis]
MENLNEIVYKVFEKEVQIKRVIKDLEHLYNLDQQLYDINVTCFGLGIKIIVILKEELLIKNLLDFYLQYQPIKFEILLYKTYPFTFPQFICQTNFSEPSLADGRDLIDNIIEQQWIPSILLYQIVEQIPGFLVKSEKNQFYFYFLFSIKQIKILIIRHIQIILAVLQKTKIMIQNNFFK